MSKIIHEAHVIKSSPYIDTKIATTVSFNTPIGLGANVNLWFNKNGKVIGLDYYYEEKKKK